jgi:hypothetical protein
MKRFFKKEIDLNDKEYLKELLPTEEVKIFYGLLHYIIGKRESLEDFFKNKEIKYKEILKIL